MDRRSDVDRRRFDALGEPLERDGDRRDEERRGTPRLSQRLWIADPVEGGVDKVFDGELGLGGASWITRYPPLSSTVEVRFRVPTTSEEVSAHAKVIAMRPYDGETHVRVMFTDLELKGELALARYLDERTQPFGHAAVA